MGLGVLVLLALFYVRLLFGPISLNFLSERAQAAVAGIVEDSYDIAWTDFGLSLTGPVSLGFHLSDVTLTDRAANAAITMEALEIGVSPFSALVGRPDARVVLIRPEIRMLQDLLGPRLARFQFIEAEGTGETVVHIFEGETAAHNVRIGDDGLSLGSEAGGTAIGLRSDNDWMVLNIEALDQALAQLADQAIRGQVRRLEIRDGTVDVLDTVYGLYKSFDSVDLEVRSGRLNGRVAADFSATIAGETMTGSIVRQIEDDAARIEADIDNIDFSTIVPFLDDATGIAALRGRGALKLAVTLDSATGRVESGAFSVDLAGTYLRLNEDRFAIAAEPIIVDWIPSQSRFSIANAEVTIGQSRGALSGDIVMGFDEQFGPTLGLSIRAEEVWLHPDDLDAPTEPFDFSFDGWSAPLYGAVGIDRLVGGRDGVSVLMRGRLDMVREGIGLDMHVSGRGASADDIKRLWPYLFAPEGRDWFTHYVNDGSVSTAEMHLAFPVGSIDMAGAPGPVPEGALTIDLVGDSVEMLAFDGLPEFQVEGQTRLTMRDNQLTVAAERAHLPEFGEIAIENAAYINQDTSAEAQIFEISGDVTGSADALLRLADSEALNLLEDVDFGIDLDEIVTAIDGRVETTVIATIATDEAGDLARTDYVLNGSIGDLATKKPIAGLNLAGGTVSFTASQEGFRVLGSGAVEDIDVNVQAIQARGRDPEILVGATLGVADAARFGIDLSEFVEGTVRVAARPGTDGTFAINTDLTDAALTIRDIGITKAQGAPGLLTANVAMGEEGVAVSDIQLAFGTVQLAGAMSLAPGGEVRSADFSTFRISNGDDARVSMTPIEGGYAFAVTGRQLDIKPVLKRFFNLEGDSSSGASEDLQNQLFAVSVNLDRAMGYYGEAILNLDLDLAVRGDQLQTVDLSAQFAGNRSASATTNALPSGRVITYATNDLGAMLRFIGIYPRLLGGTGSMVMRYDEGSGSDTGVFEVRNFAVADEQNLEAIVGEHEQSRRLVGSASTLEFDYGRAEFIRYPDRVEVVEAAVYGDTVGGTIRGNVLTEGGRYDLAGTYVPLFGLNNFFQQIPLLGPIFGGREGEGLIGVTFAVRGPLDKPDLLINPVSILAPGVFRTLFEYKAQNQAN
ncbi:hypothetical protein DVH29_07180 [Pelagibacterium lacus]|uniref:DUF3971 domain-containing protein n=1 Tax=Pelagibacterium lacus TaxID=2282655 RepID=A0A369W3W3_9HYPH|nr:hypothetical protein DVH29_07180 [Pelagibacterium lacus]